MTIVKPAEGHKWTEKAPPRKRRRKPTCWHHNCQKPSRFRVWSEEDESDAETTCYLHTPSVITWLVGGNGRTASVAVIP